LKRRLSYEERLEICKLYQDGKGTIRRLAELYGVSRTNIETILFKYRNFGEKGLKVEKYHQTYSEAIKYKLIAAYKNGEGSYSELAIKYRIKNPSMITRWVLGYNKIKTTHGRPGREDLMSRKTTLDERIKIVEYLIKHELDYHGTAIEYQVTYQQVYMWYQKYISLGVEGLKDRRGRKKHTDELSELEQLRRENERLKKELMLSEAAKEVFKKKQELEAKAHITRLGTKQSTKR